jgi:cytochrome o ubiquinol oxidase subunit 2
LGSQIYAMPGAATQLNLMADEPGIYEGHNQQFSGRGYSGMSFKAVAVTAAQFEAWVQQSRQAPDALDRARYEDLEKPGVDCPVMHFSAVESDLFEHIVARHHDTATSPLAPAGDHGGAPAMNGTAAEVR